MTRVATQPVPVVGISNYPNYAQARAYLKNFIRHGRRAFIRTKRYAYYQHSGSLRVIVILLAHDIYEVRAYPWSVLYVATIEQALAAEEFRAWLFAYDYHNRSIYYITGSQRVGIDNYRQVRQAIKKGQKLDRASQSYLSHPNHHHAT